MANIFYSDSDVMKPADHKNAVCSLLDESMMSFSNARMITHVQTSIVIITLLHTCLMWSSFANIAEFVLRFDIYIVDNRINIFSGSKQNPN